MNRRQPIGRIAFLVVMALQATANAQQTTAILEMSNLSLSGGLAASVINRTAQPVTTEVVFHRGNPLSGDAAEIGRLPLTIGGNLSARAVLPFSPAANTVYTACVNPSRALPEANYNDNCKSFTNSTQTVDLTVATPNIKFKPLGVNPGEPFTATAILRNKSALPGKAVARLYQGQPGTSVAKLLGQTSLTIAANGSALATWNVIRPAGDPNVWVSLEDVVPRESLPTDNLAPSNLYLKAVIPKKGTFNRAPVIGDLLGTGHPVAVYTENTGPFESTTASVVAVQVNNDGTSRELWRQTTSGSRTIATPLTMADLDRDGSPEIVVEIAKNMTVPPATDSQVQILALDKNGNTKWTRSWSTPGRVTCHYTLERESAPALGDLNKDGVADVVVLEKELVVLDGRTGGELVRKPGIPTGCSNASLTVVDVDGDGTNEILAGERGLYLFNADGTLRWAVASNMGYWYAVVDIEKDGIPEVVAPVQRTGLEIRNAVTGALKRRIAADIHTDFIAVSTNYRPDRLPTIFVSTNSSANSMLAIDANSGIVNWSQPLWAVQNLGVTDNPHRVVLADLLGLGRPQLITHNDRRYLGIQDSRDGSYLNYLQIFGSSDTASDPPSVADIDGDGRGEIIVPFGSTTGQTGRTERETRIPAAALLVFGSDHWKKVPTVWNKGMFTAGQVDKLLAFRHDYQPWKTHNTWMHQPLRAKCDVDFDEDVDQADIAEITASRGISITAGDWRDVDEDGAITVADSRACALQCTQPGCTAINSGARILSVSPLRGVPGTSMRVTVRGEFLGFQQGQTVMNFGAGITVDSLTVVDSNTAVANISIMPGSTGARALTIATGAKQATRQNAFLLSDGNRPPAVMLGDDVQVLGGGSVALSATVIDDAVPSAAGLAWQVVSGPGPVTFTNPSAAATTATFVTPGYYQLRLTATDGEFSGVDDMGVIVVQGNVAPYVSAGAPQTISLNQPFTLNGEVMDDGLPFASTVSSQWSFVSGPGAVSFAAASSPKSGVNFTAAGRYVLRLTATDTQLTATADVTILVNPPVPELEMLGPDSATPGQSRTVTVTGKFTNFAAGTTQANFGAGVSVGGAAAGSFGPVQVLNATMATAQITVSSSAALGIRTVTLKTGDQQATKTNAFLVGALGVPASIRPNLSDLAVAPDGTITAAPQLVDAGGNLVAAQGNTFEMTVTPKPGASLGNAPVVNGLSVRFPKLARRLLNQDMVRDPQGEFTDGDPGDPNWGKETGGLYTVTLRVPNTTLQSQTEVAVLPSGTARITLLNKQYAQDMENLFGPAADAAARQDLAALTTARNKLLAMRNNIDYDLDLLRFNHVLAPMNGLPVTVQQVTGRFAASPDDALFGRLLDSLAASARGLTVQITALQFATPSTTQLEALRTQVEAFKALQQQMGRLRPSPLAVTQNGPKLNSYFRNDVPKLLDAISKKGLEALSLLPSGTPTGQTFGVGMFAADRVHAASLDTLLTFFSNTFSIMTDLTKYTKANVIELVASLANDLVNIAIAGIANALAPPGLGIDAVVASASPLIVCPAHPNTYVEGYGLGNTENSSVAIIGCIDSYAIRNLLTLSKPKDIGAGVRLSFKIKALVEAVGRDQSIAAIEYPDAEGPGIFGPKRLTFRQGWPRVNQGRIPCVGVVIVFNHDTGGFQAVNMNVLPQCGG